MNSVILQACTEDKSYRNVRKVGLTLALIQAFAPILIRLYNGTMPLLWGKNHNMWDSSLDGDTGLDIPSALMVVPMIIWLFLFVFYLELLLAFVMVATVVSTCRVLPLCNASDLKHLPLRVVPAPPLQDMKRRVKALKILTDVISAHPSDTPFMMDDSVSECQLSASEQ